MPFVSLPFHMFASRLAERRWLPTMTTRLPSHQHHQKVQQYFLFARWITWTQKCTSCYFDLYVPPLFTNRRNTTVKTKWNELFAMFKLILECKLCEETKRKKTRSFIWEWCSSRTWGRLSERFQAAFKHPPCQRAQLFSSLDLLFDNHSIASSH